jgi:hypothetical protein
MVKKQKSIATVGKSVPKLVLLQSVGKKCYEMRILRPDKVPKILILFIRRKCLNSHFRLKRVLIQVVPTSGM